MALNGSIKFLMDPIHPALKHIVLGRGSVICRLNTAVIMEGGSENGRKSIFLDHALLFGCRHLLGAYGRGPCVFKVCIRDFVLLSTSCPQCLILSLFKNVVRPWDSTMSKSSLSYVGAPG
jgi:hypothetical protein